MKWRHCLPIVSVVWVSICAPARAAAEEKNLGFKVPDGFEVTLYAGDELAHDIFSMTIDAKGRVVVSGPGYVKILHSDNLHSDNLHRDNLQGDGAGKAVRATLFSDKPKSGAQGMYFDGPDLLCSGDGAIWRMRDTKGEDKADQSEIIVPKLANSEHGAHAIIKGPDGWFYCVCGNDAGLSKEHITTDTSPVKEPKAGAILRFTGDGKQSEVFAHGFRNPYCIDFNATGNLFTVDSDNERDHYLPWYAPCRLFDVAQGMEHGWLQKGFEKAWNRPASFFDNVERMCEIGRGSPTGLVCYRHYAFPEHYRGGLFSACWTLGKIYYFPLTRKGSTFETKLETFLEPTGNSGFAPTALAVGPAGEMYVSVGGRGTRGSVYCIRYTKALPLPMGEGRGEGAPHVEPADPLTRVLRAPQPLSSWSRAKWEPEAKKLGATPFEKLARDQFQSQADRIRAIDIITELCEGLSLEAVEQIDSESGNDVRACAEKAIARRPKGVGTSHWLIKAADSTLAVVNRSGWEGLMTLSPQVFRPSDESTYLADTIGSLIDREERDRRPRSAAILAFRAHSMQKYPKIAEVVTEPIFLAMLGESKSSAERALASLKDPLDNSSERLADIRAIQLAMGDVKFQSQVPEVYDGYIPNAKENIAPELRRDIANTLTGMLFTKDRELNIELARTLGMIGLEDSTALHLLAAGCNDGGTPQNDIHFLIALSLIPGKRPGVVTMQTAEALANLHRKMIAREWLPSRNWPLRVGELFEALVERDPKLPAALGNAKAFGLPEHSLFVLKLKGAERENLARKLLTAVRSQISNPKSEISSPQPPVPSPQTLEWTPQFIECLKSLPRAETIADLRARWDEPALRDAIAAILAEAPEAADRERFVQTLASVQAKVVEQAANALTKLPREHSPVEIAAALRALRQVCQEPQDAAARQAIANLLNHWTGETITIDEGDKKNLLAAYQPWYDWFAKTHPDEAAKLRASTTYDEKAWLSRLAKIDFDRGDATGGKIVFDRRNCSKCHQGSGKLGPELIGAAARFSREDLFVAILDPSKDVAPLYRTKIVTTTAGETFTGLIVYESPEGFLLQTGPDTTIRITNVPEGSVRTSAISLMPTGLINDATDQELADLYAYLRTLKK